MPKFAKKRRKIKNFFVFSFLFRKKVVTSLIVSITKQNCN